MLALALAFMIMLSPKTNAQEEPWIVGCRILRLCFMTNIGA